MNHLEYRQSEAAKNMDFHLQNMDNLQKDANTTLTFLYVVISASFSASVKLFADGNYPVLTVALACICLFLVASAIYLVIGCMMARPVKAPSNEPKNLKIPAGYTSEEIQDFELDNLQERIEFNRDRNEESALRLNRVRIMICSSPVIFAVLLAVLALLPL
jgi:hypothetical protein